MQYNDLRGDPMKWKTVIFDMDGTVLDTLEDLLSAMNHAMIHCGYNVHTLDEMRTFVGDGLYMMSARAVPQGNDEEAVQRVYRLFKAYYNEHLNIKTRPYNGICEMLDALKRVGIKTGISSNKFDAGAKMLSDIHFGSLIDYIVGESEAVPKKPDPAGTLLIMEKLEAVPETTLYVGDSAVDIQTARNAQLSMIAVDWGFRSREQLLSSGATKIVSTVSELKNFILN